LEGKGEEGLRKRNVKVKEIEENERGEFWKVNFSS